MALTVHTDPVQSLGADFVLVGDARAGSLTLETRMGVTLGQLQWDAEGARLLRQGEPQRFATLDELTLYLTGAVLPWDSLFAWLAGTEATAVGWQADLRAYSQGRIRAQRSTPEPAVDLRLLVQP